MKKYGTDCVRVDANGNPTGYISEPPAISLVAKISMTKDECKNGLLMWQEKAFSYGFTAVTEAALNIASPYILRLICKEQHNRRCGSSVGGQGPWRV